MKVLLADPPAPAWNSYMRSFPNLGLLYLAGYARQEIPGLDIRYLDANHSLEEHLHYVSDLHPSVYGLSFASPLNTVAKDLLRKVRALLPDSLIVCGGPHPTADPHDVLLTTPADLCCLGEGEETFAEILRRELGDQSLSDVSGIAYRQPDGSVALTPKRPVIRELDSIPLPDWNLVDLRRFRGLRTAKTGPSTAITASRGCAFNCTFCSNPIWKNATPWVRRRSPKQVAAEVELLYERGIREIYIRSDLMNDKLDWAIDVFDALHDLNHSDLYFQCNLHLSRITPELAKAMRRAGCWLCNVGLESGSQRVLNGIKKKTKLSELEHRLRTLKDEGIKVYAFMMLYQLWESESGLEWETTREVFQSIRLVLSLKVKGLLDQMSWAFATPYPGSDLYRVCKKFGLLPSDFDQSLVSSDSMSIPIPGASRLEIGAARLAGLSTQFLVNIANKERFERHVLVPNAKHAIAKLRYLVRDLGRLAIDDARKASCSTAPPTLSVDPSPERAGPLVQLHREPLQVAISGRSSSSLSSQLE